MPGIIKRLSVFIVIGSIITAVVFNVVVLSSCEFFIGATDDSSTQDNNVELGLFRFSVNDANSTFDTEGSCEDYSNWPQGENLPETIRAAQVCGCLAPIFGLILLFLVLINQCCCKVPCGSILLGISHTGVNVSMALVWLIIRNDVCDTLRGGCDWGDAAIYHLVSELLYIVAAIFARCMPTPDERRADTAEAKAQSSEADATQLQQELTQQKERVQELEQENDKTKTALAAATAATATAAAAEAAEIHQLKERLAQKNDELDQLKDHAQELEKEKDKTTALLAAATAAASTAALAEAAKIQELKDQLAQKEEEYNQRLQELENDNDKTTAALAAATAATSTAAIAEAAKIQELKEQLTQKEEEYNQRVQELEEENDKTTAALAAATAATSTAALAEAAKIQELQEQLAQKEEQIQQLQLETPAEEENEAADDEIAGETQDVEYNEVDDEVPGEKQEVEL